MSPIFGGIFAFVFLFYGERILVMIRGGLMWSLERKSRSLFYLALLIVAILLLLLWRPWATPESPPGSKLLLRSDYNWQTGVYMEILS